MSAGIRGGSAARRGREAGARGPRRPPLSLSPPLSPETARRACRPGHLAGSARWARPAPPAAAALCSAGADQRGRGRSGGRVGACAVRAGARSPAPRAPPAGTWSRSLSFFFFLVLPDQLFGFGVSSSRSPNGWSRRGLAVRPHTRSPPRRTRLPPGAAGPSRVGRGEGTALSWVPPAPRRRRLERLKPPAGEEGRLGVAGGRAGLGELKPLSSRPPLLILSRGSRRGGTSSTACGHRACRGPS